MARRVPQRQRVRQRHVRIDREKRNEVFIRLGLLLFCGLGLASGFVYAGRQHFTSLNYGYKTQEVRRERDRLAEEQRRYLLQREAAASPIHLEQAAKQLGMQPLEAARIYPVRQAKNQQLGAIETSPTRGQLLDRQGRELARSIDTESFFADPREIANVDDTARKVASITGQKKDDISSRIGEAKDSNKKFIWLIRRLDLTTATKLDAMNLDGVYSRREPKRYYPNDALA